MDPAALQKLVIAEIDASSWVISRRCRLFPTEWKDKLKRHHEPESAFSLLSIEPTESLFKGICDNRTSNLPYFKDEGRDYVPEDFVFLAADRETAIGYARVLKANSGYEPDNIEVDARVISFKPKRKLILIDIRKSVETLVNLFDDTEVKMFCDIFGACKSWPNGVWKCFERSSYYDDDYKFAGVLKRIFSGLGIDGYVWSAGYKSHAEILITNPSALKRHDIEYYPTGIQISKRTWADPRESTRDGVELWIKVLQGRLMDALGDQYILVESKPLQKRKTVKVSKDLLGSLDRQKMIDFIMSSEEWECMFESTRFKFQRECSFELL